MNNYKVEKRNVEAILGLTAMQEGMLFHYLSNPDSKQYFEQIRLRLTCKSKINIKWFKKAWKVVCHTNEVLRTVIRWEKLDEPVQIVLKDKEIPIRVLDLSEEYKEKQPVLPDKIIKDDRNETIDLTKDPLRITLCMLNGRQSEMVITFHHILYDGWSNAIVLREFLETYNRLSKGEKPGTIEKTKYKEFFKWYRRQDKHKQREFWKSYLHGFETRTLLPYDKSKLEDIRNVETIEVEITQTLKHQLDTCWQNHNLTVSTLIYTAWGLLLQKYNNADDIIFGTAVSGRTPVLKGIDDIVGLFMNTLPLRLRATKDNTVVEIFHLISNHLKERNDYEHSSFVEIKKLSAVGSDGELFDSLIIIDNYPLYLDKNLSDIGHLTIHSYEIFEMTNFDLTWQVLLFDNMKINLHYNKDLFEVETVKRLANHFINLLKEIANHPSQKVSEIGMLSESEKEKILLEFNNSPVDYPGDKTIQQLFQEQAARTPLNKAVQFKDRWLTYKELNVRSNQLAYRLIENGVADGSKVALMFPRSINMIVGMLGILKANAACIPLDISYPRERIGFIIQDSQAKFILKHSEIQYNHSSVITGTGMVTEINYHMEEIITDKYKAGNLRKPNQPNVLSYMIYTSGSTGKPKAALLNHSGVINHAYTKIDVLEIIEKDTVANNFSINFIASIWQVLAPLFIGARVMVYSEDIERDPYAQFEQAVTDGVTILQVVPSIMKAYLYLLDEGKKKINLGSIKRIALTGEESKPSLVSRFYKTYHIPLVNCYGQTECCDDVLHYKIPVNSAADIERVPIGNPSHHTQILILNHHDQLQPIGVVGEICVIGTGVAYGYWNRPELTAEKFGIAVIGDSSLVIRSFSSSLKADEQWPITNDRFYRTGDLGRWLPDGNVEYTGRIDHQVKIRGNRVELREIENRVMSHDAVKEAAVIAKENTAGEKNLYAFFVSDTTEEITTADIRQYLSKTLPDYMIPAHFVRMEKLPLTPNGKIDRKTLVKAEIKGIITSGTEYKPPRSEFEMKIQEIWGQLLDKDKEQIGINDNFFDLGGHSLLLIKLKSKLEKAFELNLKQDIPIVELFNHPTISRQAQYIEERFNIGEKPEEEDKSINVPKRVSASAKRRVDNGNREIAVIGMVLHIPNARTIDEFWRNLINGTESISFFKEEELESSFAYQVLQGHSTLIRAGGVLGDIDLFDADFFGYTPREAEIMDPQQRLFLEYTWMALEDAGYGREIHQGTIGVYAGVGWNTYLLNYVLANPGVINAMGEFQTMIGNDKDFLATRVSYKLNLKGPSLTVQTACSTSLVAVHLARQGLLNGDCDMALAGGIVVRVPEKTGYLYTKGGHLSSDGHCRAFDAEAKGTVFSNGIGIVVLKRLEDAREDRDHIYAVIKGLAINNDGSLKVGYTSPSEIQQSQVISDALIDAGVDLTSIGYIETHGTGTMLGDPVEISALTNAFRTAANNNTNNATDKNKYCAIGSIKSNVGHLDVAAGIIGLIKAVLCLKHKQIPPSINFEHLNPMIDFTNSPFYINRTLKDWPENQTKIPRRAGVSALGIGGTNVHVILEEAPGRKGQRTEDIGQVTNNREYQLILLSAKTQTALERMSQNLADHLKQYPNINLADAAYTLQVGRAKFQHRKMFLCPFNDLNEAIAALSTPEKLKTFYAKIEELPVIFMFPGQGSQYINMGLQLYQQEPVFRAELDRCFEILKPLMGYDLKEILYPPSGGNKSYRSNKSYISPINQTEIAQPVLFILEYALAKLLIKWGVKPYAMIGHSIGEYVAACLSGVLSLEDALKLVAVRGQLMQKMPPGAMLSVSLSEKEIIPLLSSHDELSLAAVNSSTLCVISGPGNTIDAFENQLKEKGYDCSRLHTSHAFHSPMMDPILKPFAGKVKEIRCNNPGIPYISNVTGDWIGSREVTSPEYWNNHLRNTVRFADGLEKLLRIESSIFIEIGPGKVLSTFVRAHAHKKEGQMVIELLRHPKKKISDIYYLLDHIGKLWLYGVNIDWHEFYAQEERHRIPLPTYPFERKKYLLQAEDKDKESRIHVSSHREISQVKRKIDDWFYMPAWKQTVPVSSNKMENAEGVKVNENEKECWLFFLDDDVNIDLPGIGHQVIEQLTKDKNHENIDIIGVKIGKQFDKYSEKGYVDYILHPGHYEDYTALFQDLQNRDKTINKIVHLWTLSTTSSFGGLERGVNSLLYLVKAMGKLFMFNQLDLRVISRGLHIIESGDNCIPENAALLGPCNVIPQEYPNITCRSIDINGDGKHVLQNLVSELNALPPERTTAYRGNHRWVQIFAPIKPPKSVGVPDQLRTHGVYLIVGGLGNIGLTIAEYLAQAVQAKLILTARSKFPGKEKWESPSETHDDSISGKIMRIKKLEKMGAEVLVLQADVAHKEQMKRVVNEVENRFGALHGVIHAAGLIDERYFNTILDLEKEDCEPHFKPKIQGLHVMDDVLKDKELDFCILNSSLSSILGGLTMYAYSAANSFMDAFAQKQSETLQKNWISINWDEWEGDKSQVKRVGHPGLGGRLSGLNITSKEGKEVFKQVLLLNKIPQIIVSTGDLYRRLHQWVFADFESQEDKTQKKIDNRFVHKRPNVQSIYEAPQNETEKIVAEIWQELLGIDSIGVHDDFFELGGHSLLATKLVSRIREIFRIDLPLNILFDKSTIREVVDNIVHTWGDREVVEEIAKTYREVQLLT